MFNRLTEKFKGYRTVIANMLLATLPVVVTVDPASLNLSVKQLSAFTVFVAICNIYLRFKTNTAIGQKDVSNN